MSEEQTAENTDREIYREREGDYYSDSIHVTETGHIGFSVAGSVIVKPLRSWMELAAKHDLKASVSSDSGHTPEQIRELIEAARAAGEGRTEGPWSQEYNANSGQGHWIDSDFAPNGQGVCDMYHREGSQFFRKDNAEPNSRFIAHMGTHADTLLSALEQVLGEMEQLEKLLKPFSDATLTSCSVLYKNQNRIQAVATFDTDNSQDVIDAFNNAGSYIPRLTTALQDDNSHE